MIPAGRDAVDLADIAELHGLTDSQARRRRPWAQPGHPAPLTVGRARNGHPQLWDREQATAYAKGEPIPPLPEPGQPDDLLDVSEAAALAGMKPATWTRYQSHERARDNEDGVTLVPECDVTVCGCQHWYRRTVESYRDARQQRAGTPSGGRPKGSTGKVSLHEIGPRIAALLDERDNEGEPLSVAEIARRAGVDYTTALRRVHQLRGK